ncbi:MAG: hypothetical protein K6E11_03505, partial [Bacilli bacterium]|nr:hypothetical protein [Bacilli bacterium]
MKKKALLLIPFLVLGLSGCNEADEEDTPVYDSGSVPADPIQPSGNGGNEDHTSQEDMTLHITEIQQVVSKPDYIDVDEGLENESVTLKVLLSNGSTLQRHPNSITFDAAGKVVGDAITCTAHINELTIDFECEMYIMPRDVISPDTTGNPKTGKNTYSKWNYNSTTTTAKYEIVSSGQTYVNFAKEDKEGIGFPGFVSTHSGGKIKKVVVDWDMDETGKNAMALFTFSTTPFANTYDVSKLTPSTSIKIQNPNVVAIPKSDKNYYYVGMKAYDGGVAFKSITIYWDTAYEAPSLSSLAIDEASTVHSETDLDTWDFSGVKVNGTFSDETVADITKLCTLSSTTPVPDTPTEDMDVSVTATYSHDESKTITSTVKGTVDLSIHVVEIQQVVSCPENFDLDDGFENDSIVLKVLLNNGQVEERHPESVTYDGAGKGEGDTVVCTAHLDGQTIDFNCIVKAVKKDELSPATITGLGSDYTPWTKDSSDFDAKYAGLTKSTEGFTLGTSAVASGFPGIISTQSGGRAKKIVIEWDCTKTSSASAELLVFGKTTPFISTGDLQSLGKSSNPALTLSKQEDAYSHTFTNTENFYYLGFKAYGANVTLLNIKIYWDETQTAPTISTLSFSSDSTVSSETGLTTWDFSKVKVNGTYSDGSAMDVTRLTELTSSTPVPSVVTAQMDVSVTAAYTLGSDTKSHTDNVKGSVAQGMVTAASFTFGGDTTGGEFSRASSMSNDNTNHSHNEGSTVKDYFVQVLNAAAYWSSESLPTKVVIYATIGSGKVIGDLGEDKIYVSLLDSAGNVIGSLSVLVDNMEVKEFTEYSLELTPVAGVCGFKITHHKIANQTVRFQSASLRYIA